MAYPRGRLFAVLVIHLDDSGENTEPVQTLAGFVATADSWLEFEAEAQDYLSHKCVPYLHTVDLYHRRNVFEGWNSGQTRQFAEGLFRILGKHVARGTEFSVLRHIFNDKKRSMGLAREGSPYEFCFKGMSTRILNDGAFKKVLAMPEVDLTFVFENREANKGGIQRAFTHYQAANPKWRALIFEDKKKLIALQVSDFLAFFTRRSRVAQVLGKPFERDLTYLEEVIAPVTFAPFLATDFHE
jgi:hypothetical protein